VDVGAVAFANGFRATWACEIGRSGRRQICTGDQSTGDGRVGTAVGPGLRREPGLRRMPRRDFRILQDASHVALPQPG
jgi:hypothetical protein